MLRDRIELARVQLHDILILNVIGLVYKLLQGGIAARGVGLKRRGDAEDLYFLVADVRVLELHLESLPVFELREECVVVKSRNDFLDLDDPSFAILLVKGDELPFSPFELGSSRA